MRSEDLLASVFPHASACPETLAGDIEIPDHPLVREVMKDTLTEAMDLDGLLDVLRGIDDGSIRCIAVDTPIPSQFAHELINAMPYAYLDDAGTEERRARAVSTRRALPDSPPDATGLLDQAAIDTVREQLWPDVRDEHELHDLLLSLVALPLDFIASAGNSQHWPLFFDRLTQHGRASVIELDGVPAWIATERLFEAALLWADSTIDTCHPERSEGSASLPPRVRWWSPPAPYLVPYPSLSRSSVADLAARQLIRRADVVPVRQVLAQIALAGELLVAGGHGNHGRV